MQLLISILPCFYGILAAPFSFIVNISAYMYDLRSVDYGVDNSWPCVVALFGSAYGACFNYYTKKKKKKKLHAIG